LSRLGLSSFFFFFVWVGLEEVLFLLDLRFFELSCGELRLAVFLTVAGWAGSSWRSSVESWSLVCLRSKALSSTAFLVRSKMALRLSLMQTRRLDSALLESQLFSRGSACRFLEPERWLQLLLLGETRGLAWLRCLLGAGSRCFTMSYSCDSI